MWCGNSQKNVGVKVPVKAAKPGVMFVEQPGWAPVPQQPLNTELPCWSTYFSSYCPPSPTPVQLYCQTGISPDSKWPSNIVAPVKQVKLLTGQNSRISPHLPF